MEINGFTHKDLSNPCVVSRVPHQPFTHLELGEPSYLQRYKEIFFVIIFQSLLSANNLIFITWDSHGMRCESRRMLAAAAVISAASFCDNGT